MPKNQKKAEPKPEEGDPPAEQEEKKFQDQLEEWGDKIAASVKYDRLTLWKEILFHPTKTLASEMATPSLKRAAKDVFVSSLPVLILGLIGVALLLGYVMIFGIFTAFLIPGLGVIGLGGLIAFAIIFLILYFLRPIISWFITAVIQFIIAKILGGKADFRTQAYLLGLANASTTAVESGLAIGSLIPCVGWLLQPIRMLVGFYGIYLNYKGVKIAHGLDKTRAAVVVLLPIVLWIGLIVALVIMFYVSIFSMFFLGAAAGGVAAGGANPSS